MAKLVKPRVPTGNQAGTLQWLAEGRELVIGKYPHMPDFPKHSGQERIYWLWHEPSFVTMLNPTGKETIECGYPPKLKRYLMSHMERYGWVERHPTGWTITEEGRKANQRYQDWWEQVKREHNW